MYLECLMELDKKLRFVHEDQTARASQARNRCEGVCMSVALAASYSRAIGC
jgi:hypothetical protein